MKNCCSHLLFLLGFVVSTLVLCVESNGQSTTQGSGTIQSQSQSIQGQTIRSQISPAEAFQQRFWQYLVSGPAGYDQWGPFPGKDAGMYEGQSPHGAYLRMFANKVARQNPQSLPSGSILVKENYAQDGQTLMAVTVMYRSQGYDAAHYDWYWIKYNPNGTVALTAAEQGSRPIAGRFASCIDCHSGAAGNDFAFVND